MNRYSVTTDSGVRLCLHRVEAEGQCIGLVVLAHGMFSNYRTCRGLAKHLSACNFECWLLDSQGHGFSEKAAEEPDFETMCLEDTKAVLNFLKSRSVLPLWWVGHSGGGLAILMYLARNQGDQMQLSGIVTLASQSFGAGFTWSRRWFFRLCRIATSMAGSVPGKALRLGPENESAAVMNQWLGWSICQTWKGADGFDYKSGVGAIKLPILTLTATGDRYIAPVSGCELLHSAVGSSDKQMVCFGRRYGHLEDYTHSRVVSSRNAAIDVWPLVSEWLLSIRNNVTDANNYGSDRLW